MAGRNQQNNPPTAPPRRSRRLAGLPAPVQASAPVQAPTTTISTQPTANPPASKPPTSKPPKSIHNAKKPTGVTKPKQNTGKNPAHHLLQAGVAKAAPTISALQAAGAQLPDVSVLSSLQNTIASLRAQVEAARDLTGTIVASCFLTDTFQYGKRGVPKVERRLQARLEVSPNAGGSVSPVDSRIWYDAEFKLLPEDPKSDEEAKSVASISAVRIDKQTQRAPNASASWIRDYLEPDMDTYDNDDVSGEIAYTMRALFRKDGRPRAKVKGLRDELNDRGLIFIKLVSVAPEFQKSGLVGPMLKMYRQMLQQLPEWYAFTDVLVLTPGRPGGSAGDVWEGTSDDQVIETLRGVYERSDGYQFLIDGRVGSHSIPVMGRMTCEDEGTDDGDDAEDTVAVEGVEGTEGNADENVEEDVGPSDGEKEQT